MLCGEPWGNKGSGIQPQSAPAASHLGEAGPEPHPQDSQPLAPQAEISVEPPPEPYVQGGFHKAVLHRSQGLRSHLKAWVPEG